MTNTPRRKTFLQELQEAKELKRRGRNEQRAETEVSSGQTNEQTNSGPAPVQSEQSDRGAAQLTPFQQRLNELRRKRESSTALGSESISGLAPDSGAALGGGGSASRVDLEANHSVDVPRFETGLSVDEQGMDRFLAGLDIVDCYNRWSGKKEVRAGSRRESIKCSCPDPAHPDANPSAWMNRDKNVGYCSGCNAGFDLWDIAAWRFGYPVPGYKTDKEMFRKLRDQIVGDLGYKVVRISGTKTYVPPEEPPKSEETLATVTPLRSVPPPPPSQEDDEEEVTLLNLKVASIDWKPIVTPGTFLDEWMASTTRDTCPEEFHLFTGLMAIGFAVGRNRTLLDEPEVVPNLNICLVGQSGTGKSRAKRHLKNVIEASLPFNDEDPFPTGTKQIGTPGSGEAIIKELNHEVDDPSAPGQPRKRWPIRGYVDYDEMATLIAKGSRMGSSLKSILMELYDAPPSVSNVTVTGGRVYAKQPFVQVMTTTQNKTIRGILSDKDDASGFVNRWAFVTGPPKPPVAINTVIVDLQRPAEMLKAISMWAINPLKITFTDSALKKFSDFILNKVIPAKEKEENNSDIFNRIDLLLKKLVVLLACNEKKDIIDDDVVEKMMLFYPYLRAVYGVVDVEMAKTISGELSERVVEIINKFYDSKNKYPTAREILQRLSAKQRDQDSLRKTLATMVELGLLLVEEIPGARGKVASRYGIPA